MENIAAKNSINHLCESIKLTLGDERVDLFPSNAVLISVLDWKEVLYDGAHVAVAFRTDNPLAEIAWHHGIYVGNRTVIDNNDRDNSSSIRLTSFEEFIEVGDIMSSFALISYEDDNDEKRNISLNCANTLLNSESNVNSKLYDLVSFNCQHFATFCRTGQLRLAHDYIFDNIYIEVINLFNCGKRNIGQNKLRNVKGS